MIYFREAKNIFLRIMVLTILAEMISCTGPPRLAPVKHPLPVATDENCTAPFPDNRRQFVHSIQATMPKGEKAILIGITDLCPRSGEIHCVIMTLEGLVLFDAQYDHKIVINRGIPPFDSMDFARGLMNDIRLIFFPPDGRLIQAGISDNGSSVCRYERENGMIVDVISSHNGPWEIRQYNADLTLNRSVKAFPNSKGDKEGEESIPARLVLTAYGSPRYSLSLELIEARESEK